MHCNEPLPIALDHEVTIHLEMADLDMLTHANSPVVLRIDEHNSSFFSFDHTIDRDFTTPVDVKTTLQVGETGIRFISAIWIHLNLTVKELFAKLVFEGDSQSDGEIPNDPTAKVYVNVLLQDGTYHVHIQTPYTVIHDAEYRTITR